MRGLDEQHIYQPGEGEDRSVQALAFELKNPLINIARRAELADQSALSEIQKTAERTLMLIDSFLLSAQTEYGQLMLDLEPTSVGSILYDVSSRLRETARQNNASLLLDDRTTELVMTHRKALTSIVSVFGDTLLGYREAPEHKELTLRGYKTRSGKMGIGIFADIDISMSDLRSALRLQGRAHMPLSKINGQTHASLAIAGDLCRAIGGEITVKRMGSLNGFATELPSSEQLAFV